MRRQEPGRRARRCRDLDLVTRTGRQRRLLEHGRELLGIIAPDRSLEVKDDLLKRIGAYLGNGRPATRSIQNHIGALVNKAHFDKVTSFLGDAREKLSVAHGGVTQTKRLRGMRPSLTASHETGCSEKSSGPIPVGNATFNTLSEAIALANDTNYGLTASVYTGSLRNAIKLSREESVPVSLPSINFGEGDASTPFGGYKESGFGGRDKSVFRSRQLPLPNSRRSGSTSPSAPWTRRSDDNRIREASAGREWRLRLGGDQRAPVPLESSRVPHPPTGWLSARASAGLSAARRLQALRPGEKIVLLDAGEIGRNLGSQLGLHQSTA